MSSSIIMSFAGSTFPCDLLKISTLAGYGVPTVLIEVVFPLADSSYIAERRSEASIQYKHRDNVTCSFKRNFYDLELVSFDTVISKDAPNPTARVSYRAKLLNPG